MMRITRALVFGMSLLLGGGVTGAEPVSGYQFLDESTRAMQDDDFENPGMVAVDLGDELFHELREDEEYRCSDCLSEDAAALESAQTARYPVFDPNLGGLVTIFGAVIYAELGCPPPLARGFFGLSRSVGLLAHAWEQTQQGGRNKGPTPPAYRWTYAAPE